MFDDPKKELERLQNELLAAQEEPEAEDEDIDADQALADIRRMLAREDWEEDEREPLYRSYTDWEEETPPERPRISDPPRKKQKPEPQKPPRRRSGYGLLLAVLLLETVALAVMALWWYLWLR